MNATAVLMPVRRYILFSDRSGAPVACSLPLPEPARMGEWGYRLTIPEGLADYRLRVVEMYDTGSPLPSYYEAVPSH